MSVLLSNGDYKFWGNKSFTEHISCANCAGSTVYSSACPVLHIELSFVSKELDQDFGPFMHTHYNYGLAVVSPFVGVV